MSYYIKYNLEDREFLISYIIPKNIVYLRLDKCFDIDLSTFKNLKELIIENCQYFNELGLQNLELNYLKISNCKRVKKLNLLKIKQLRELRLNDTYLEELKVNNNLKSLSISIDRNKNIDIFKDFDYNALTNLESLIIDNVNIVQELNFNNLVNLKSLTLTCNNNIKDLNKLINLEYLILDNMGNIEELNFNDLINLKSLTLTCNNIIKVLDLNELINLESLKLKFLTNLQELRIDHLKNLKELYVNNLFKLEVLRFNRLSLLTFGNLEELKYIDGYYENLDNIIETEPLIIKQKIINRNRINLIKDLNNECICARCHKNVSLSKKINLRNTDIEYIVYENDLSNYEYVKILTCC